MKSNDPTISSPILYADLKRQNFPTCPLLLTILYTSVEDKTVRRKHDKTVRHINMITKPSAILTWWTTGHLQ